MTKIKYIRILTVAAAILLILLVLSLLPRVASVESLPFDAMTEENCPELYRAYQELYGDAGGWYAVTPETYVEVLTVKNLWTSCEYYFLPCYLTSTRTVPRSGSLHWSAEVHVLSACSKENSLLSLLCDRQIRDLSLCMKPGEHTFVYDFVEIYPEGILYNGPTYDGASFTNTVSIHSSVKLANTPRIRFSYSIATSDTAPEERGQETTVAFVWNYSLYVCGKPIRTYRDASVTRDYIVNA